MKTPQFLTCLFVVLLTSCNGSSQRIEVTPTAIGVEVTKVVQITTTPNPTKTVTSLPTLNERNARATAIAMKIGTPIVASRECYETAQSQRDLIACAGTRLAEVEKQMSELLKVLEPRYDYSQVKLEAFRTLQAQWEDFGESECVFRSNLDSDLPGTITPMSYAECMVAKYEDRLREYQVQIFEWHH